MLSDVHSMHRRRGRLQRYVDHRSLYQIPEVVLSLMMYQDMFYQSEHVLRTLFAHLLYHLLSYTMSCTLHAHGSKPHNRTQLLKVYKDVRSVLKMNSRYVPLIPANARLKHSFMIFSADALWQPWKSNRSSGCV